MIYRQISILQLLSGKLSNNLDNIFSKLQCGFRTGFSAQHCLLSMIDNWKKAVNKNKIFKALLTDLSNKFDCICHDLRVAKLYACLWSTSFCFENELKLTSNIVE